MLEALLKKLGIAEDVIQKVIKGMSDEKIYTTKEENIEERYTKLKEQKEDVEGQLKTANTTIKDLKKNNGDNETLQKTIKDHEVTIETLKKDSEAKIRNITLDGAIEKALTKSKAKHTDLLATKIDREKLVISEDGKVSGLDEQLKGLKESYKDLFEEKLSGKPPVNTESSLSNNTFEALVNNADNMTAEEVAAQFTAMNENK
ncbi:phage scaffolding protein [Clostridium botulinum]|uniref:phage scaffolding protein n=1 Tax=Clostridium botulinum TaxID=1491 RepID=UPI002246255F|nr:phage scaffolding protein [Clostridium botulinum]UZP02298.1 phage scaffolding protein [Clostridium botulinum]UZP05657.1 phage scaffolding protein [Clostridium botulinum]UZP09037.1 phage scaffolding protein [Clostridium botulinum]